MIEMKRIILLFIFVLIAYSVLQSAIALTIISGDSWTVKAPMQQERGRLGVATVDDKIYAIGGDIGRIFGQIEQYKSAGTSLVVNTTEEYDPARDNWAYKAPMPTARDYFGTAVFDGKIYCIGGMTANAITDVNEVYNPATDTWETKSSMPIPVYILNAHVINDKIYIIDTASDGHTQVYDPNTDSWILKSSPPNRIQGSASAVVNNKIYLVDTFGNITTYDPITDSWQVGSKALGVEWSTSAGVFANGLHIFFFSENATYTYTPLSDNWSTEPAMSTPRGYSGVASIDNSFYVIGGVTFPLSGFGEMSPNAANEQFTPAGYETDVSPTPCPTAVGQNNTLIAVTSAITITAIITGGIAVYFKKFRQCS